LLLGALVVLVAATPAVPSASQQPDTVFRLAQQEPPDPFDPATLGENRTIELAQNVFDSMTQVNESNLSIQGALARRWTVSNRGTVYTFTLRNNITFQDGRRVTAQDIVYSLNRALSPAVKTQYAFFLSTIKGATAVAEGKAKTVSGIRAIGQNRVQITLNNPAPYFPALAAMWPYWVVDRVAVQRYGNKWTDPPNINGTGAFRHVSAVPDSRYVFEANPSYFLSRPRVGRVEVTIVPDPAAQLARYRAGEFDVIQNLSPATYAQARANAQLRRELRTRPILRTTWINMLNDREPFNDPRVRRAFNQAIDKNRLVQVALGGLGKAAHTFLPPGMPGSVAATRRPAPYAPQAAKTLLSQAGFPDGDGFPNIALTYSARSDFQAVAQFVQGELKRNLGIDITLRPRPARAFNDEINDTARRPIMSLFSFGLDYPDPQEQHEYLGVSGPNGFANYTNFKSTRFDNLIARANRTVSFKARMRLHRQAENVFLNATPIVPLYNPIASWLQKPYVRGFTVTPLYMSRWAGVSINR
jgi:ABC-type oligopeptide transport system substrate-binding subunit